MRSKFNKIVSVILTLAMLFSIAPTTAFGTVTGTGNNGETGDTADARAKLLIDKYINDTELIDDPEILDLMKKKLLKKLRIDELPHQVCIKTNKCLNSIQKLAVVEVRANGIEIRRG